MHTVTLQAIKHPSRLAVLLRALVETFEMLPERAREIADRDGLPPPLRGIAQCATHLDACWACWTDEAGHAWFFVAEMPLELSREWGAPVLQLDRYDEDGLILQTGRWMEDSTGRWSRLRPGAAPAPSQVVPAASQMKQPRDSAP